MAGFITGDGADYLIALAARAETTVDYYWLALTSVVPAPYQSWEEIGEVTAESYNRIAIPATPTAWFRSGTTIGNSAELVFPGAEQDWGPVAGWALLDDESQGRLLFGGDLAVVWDVQEGYEVVFTPGMLTITIPVSEWSLEV